MEIKKIEQLLTSEYQWMREFARFLLQGKYPHLRFIYSYGIVIYVLYGEELYRIFHLDGTYTIQKQSWSLFNDFIEFPTLVALLDSTYGQLE